MCHQLHVAVPIVSMPNFKDAVELSGRHLKAIMNADWQVTPNRTMKPRRLVLSLEFVSHNAWLPAGYLSVLTLHKPL